MPLSRKDLGLNGLFQQPPIEVLEKFQIWDIISIYKTIEKVNYKKDIYKV